MRNIDLMDFTRSVLASGVATHAKHGDSKPSVAADCINVCAVVTSERNCICYPCGATEYPSSQVDKDPVTGETCESCAGSLM